jgi:deoxyribodipyrimidine photo-lyase
MTQTTIVWFRDDLRLTDHPALTAAAAESDVHAVFVFDEIFEKTGAAGKWWLHQSLASLGRDLACGGGQLTLKRGAASDALLGVAQACRAHRIHVMASRIPAERDHQLRVANFLAQYNIELVMHGGSLLHSPAKIRTKSGGPFKVFTPFWKAFRTASPGLRRPLPVANVSWSELSVPSDDLAAWQLLPTAPDWAGGFRAAWSVSEQAAHEQLQRFLEYGLCTYPRDRDHPDCDGTSRMSPYLRWGQLSPFQVWWQVRDAMAASEILDAAGEAYLRQLAWREFSHHILWDFPQLASENWRSNFDAFPWRRDEDQFENWRIGETGYPFVDAAMRELMATGWMHNRGRMVTASFLIKHLLHDWRDGLAWFDDALVDADPALDPFGWQWVAGSGADASPYFRIFNPTTQGEKFDPKAKYILKWCPELVNIKSLRTYEPLATALVDHVEARKRAMDAFRQISGAVGSDN